MTVAAFDFDGTLTTKDTLFDFLHFSFGRKRLYLALIKLFPHLFLHKIGILSNEQAKQKLFAYFFAGMPVSTYQQLCRDYASTIDNIIRDPAMKKLLWHQQQGAKVVIISASMEDWIKPWGEKHRIDLVLATQIEIVHHTVTGKFISRNCYGIEKVNRLLSEFPDKTSYELYAYGDSKGDKELLALADVSFYRKF